MVTVLNKPSILIDEVAIGKVGNWSLFKFSQPLQDWMELPLDKKKADELSAEEMGILRRSGSPI
ncbi:MAG: hypothetical protein RLZZ511_3293 [Cyanobacteriota bacterium]|jgi:hypothetical protein